MLLLISLLFLVHVKLNAAAAAAAAAARCCKRELQLARRRERRGGSLAEWLACWTQAQKGLGSNRICDAVG